MQHAEHAPGKSRGWFWQGGCLLLAAALLMPGPQAATPITGFGTTTVAPTAASYTTPGAGTTSYPSSTTFTIQAGQANDVQLDSITFNGKTALLRPELTPDIHLRRAGSVNGVTDRQIIWYKRQSKSGNTVSFDGSLVADEAAALASRYITRGSDNIFGNQGDGNGNNNNVERVDYIFRDWAIRPQTDTHLTDIGVAVLDRGGNDAFKIAAVIGVDAAGNPTAYAGLIGVDSSAWGSTSSAFGGPINTTVIRGDTADPNGHYAPSADPDGQHVRGLFFSLADLGVSGGQTVYGYSLFGYDVTDGGNPANLLDWTQTGHFPQTTSSSSGYGGLDLVSGGFGFIEQSINPQEVLVPVPEPAVAGGIIGLTLLCWAAGRNRRTGQVRTSEAGGTKRRAGRPG
ncbi:MAG: hypothetical protein D6766_01665 [Verrucomicrobia bacterium]|nr:MAG: hypothetical protein D6766_01665 [Verrucomicrobiota bacterium]